MISTACFHQLGTNCTFPVAKLFLNPLVTTVKKYWTSKYILPKAKLLLPRVFAPKTGSLSKY